MYKKIILAAAGVALAALLFYRLSSTDPESAQPPVAGRSPIAAPQAVPRPATQPLPASQQRAPGAADTPPPASEPVVNPGAGRAQAQPPPLEPEIREALGKTLNTSSEGLVEETRDGVTSVDLQHRFQTAPVATVDENGNVQITDYSHLPKEAPAP